MIVSKSNFNSYNYSFNHDSQRNKTIASLDPLNADISCSHLPQMNSIRDIKSIVSTLQTLIPNHQQIESFNINEACAAVRDLGMFLGSIKRHGEEPIQALPEIEITLLKLGEKTNMIPRDTLVHYSVWNPNDNRQRRYTSQVNEIKMLESANIAIPRLEMAIYELLQLYNTDFTSSNFIIKCQKCATHLNGMVEAIIHIIKHVSRKIFAEELRPYFDSIFINGINYLGPGAVEMPLFIFDHILWSAECKDEIYLNFKQGFVPYCLPSLRLLYIEFENYPSLLEKLIIALEKNSPYKENIILSANETLKLFKILIKFRKPHIKVVDQAYLHMENRQREKGSGGYQVDILNYLTGLTEDAIARLENAINTYQEQMINS